MLAPVADALPTVLICAFVTGPKSRKIIRTMEVSIIRFTGNNNFLALPMLESNLKCLAVLEVDKHIIFMTSEIFQLVQFAIHLN
jgi:hypothetical protein